MQNSDIIINIVRFVVLLFIQVLMLNNINLAGYINPYLYIFFILMYPLDGNKSLLILLSFLLGLSIDVFEDSGGVHAAASAFIAYLRPLVLKYSFGVSYEYNNVKLYKATVSEKITYLGSIILFHHIVLFSLEIFSFNHMLLLLKSTLFSGVFSFILIYGSIVLFSRKVS